MAMQDLSGTHPRPLPAETPDPFAGVDLRLLEKSLRRPRTLFNAMASVLMAMMTALALIPLLSVLSMLVAKGWRRLDLSLLTQAPPAALEAGGGIGNAIVGTLIIVGLATLIAVPVGLFTAIFLAQAEPEDRLAQAIRFADKVLTGFPSILAGVFAYGAIVLLTGHFSAVAGSAALAILMLPTITLTSEEAIRMVPVTMHEAAVGMGATRAQVIWMVLLPAAVPGIATSVMLAVARAAGETAPLLFTALFSNYWLISHGRVELMQPTATLAVLIYNFAGMPFENQLELAWTAAFILVLLVLVSNLLGQFLSRRRTN
jgi:phosphate transport system permease protein